MVIVWQHDHHWLLVGNKNHVTFCRNMINEMFSVIPGVFEESPRYASVRVLDPSPMKSLNRGTIKIGPRNRPGRWG